MRSRLSLRRRVAVFSGATFLSLFLASLGAGQLSPAVAAGTAPEVGGNLSGLPVFPADNPWNQDISSAPVDPNSANLVASMGLSTSLHPDFGTYWSGAPWGIPFVTVSGSQPKVNITYTQWPGESDPGPFPIPLDAPVEGGPNGAGDRHVIVVDRDNARLYELFNAFPTANGWNASCGATYDLKSNAVRPAGWTSADAAGLPIFPGLVRYEEAVELGEIRHALRFTAVRTRRAYVYPARHYASSYTDPNLPPMGARVRLEASFDISRFPPTAQVILRALKRYGMILADNGGNWFVSGAPDPRWNDAEIDTLKGVKGSDFEVIQLGYPGAPTGSAPAAPLNLRAAAGILRANVSWSASTGATSYTLKRSNVSGTGYVTVATGLTGTSYTDLSLLAGTTYYYVVTASNSSGVSANSAQAAVVPLAEIIAAPAAPTGLQASASSAQVALTWTASTGAASYTVKRSTTSGSGYSTVAGGLTGTRYTDTAVTNGTTYFYVVSAINAGGSSANSPQVAATPVAPSTGAGTTTLRINSGGGGSSSSSGTWNGDQYFSGGTAHTYPNRDIAGTTDDALYLSVRFGRSFSYSLPATPGSYTLRLYFAECWFTTPGRVFNVSVNGSPLLSNFDIVAAAGANRLVVREFPVTVNSGNLVVSFQDVKNDAIVSALELVPATGTGNPVVSAPSAPAGLQASASNGQVALTWTGSSGAASYTVKRSTTSGSGYSTVAGGLTGTRYTDTAVTNGTTYFYVVSAVNAGGSSADSAQVTATPVAPGTGAGTSTFRINCGGSAFTAGGVNWVADQFGTGGSKHTYPSRDVQSTTEDARYLSVRYSEGTNFSYALPATPGNYTLRLHFTECWFTTPGNRIFNVKVNGSSALSNFDIVAAGGANTAVIRSVPVTAGANGITVLFENVKNGPVISGIELVPAP